MRYYLMGHICAPPIDVYRTAESLEGPWIRPMDDILLPAGNHAFHACEWRGNMMVFNWISAADRDSAGPPTRVLAPPKVAAAAADGTLLLTPFEDGWDAVAAENWRPLAPRDLAATGACYRGEWQAQGDALAGRSRPGMGIHWLAESAADFDFEATVASPDAPEVGVVFRSDAIADECMRAACIQGRHSVELAKVTLRRNYVAIGRGFEALQSRHYPFAPGRAFRLRAIAYGPYIEVSVNGSVRLAGINMVRREGRLGLFIEDGAARFSDLRLRKLTSPPLRLPPGPVQGRP